MICLLSEVSTLFRPDEETLSREAEAQVQFHRLLSLVGAAVVFFFGLLRQKTNPGGPDPLWARLVVVGLPIGLFAASYLSRTIRRHYVLGVWGAIYVWITWLTSLTTLNRFAGEYAIGLLVAYAVLGVVVALGARSVGPVLGFLGTGFLLAVGGLSLTPAPEIPPMLLLACMATVAFVEGLALQGQFSLRDRLAERERKVRSVNESISDGLYRSTPDDGLVYANQAFAEMFGYESVEAILQVDPAELYADSTERKRVLVETNEQEGLDGREIEFQRKDGMTFTGLVNDTVVRGDDGEVERYDGAITDITERKRRERELQRRSDAMEAASDGIAILGSGGKYIYMNQAHAEIYGYDSWEPFRDQTWRMCYGKEELRRFEEAVMPALFENGEWRGEATGQRADGSFFPQELALTTLEEGGIICVVRDITEQKQREQASEDRRKKIEALYKATRHLLRATSREEVFVRIHEVIRDVFEYPFGHTSLVQEGTLVPKKTTADGAFRLPQPEPRPIDEDTVAGRAIQAGEAVVVERIEDLCNDIDYGDLHSAAGVPIGERAALVVGEAEEIGFDQPDLRLLEVLGGYAALILERLSRERALQGAKEKAEEAARLKSAMLANMSHEIRTPLTSVTGFAEVLENNLEGQMQRFAEQINQSGQRLQKTLDTVLQLSRLEAGTYEPEREELSLRALIEEAAELFRADAKQKGVDLKIEAEGPVRGQFCEAALDRIAENLIENAIKFTPEGGQVIVRAREENGAALLEVEDTGIGMDPDEVEGLFEAFAQESDGAAREYEGTGLGLSIVDRFAEAQGGTVEVETEKGGGSRFTVRLPHGNPEDT